MTSIYDKKISTEVQLIHTGKMPLTHRYFPVDVVKLSKTVVVASENM